MAFTQKQLLSRISKFLKKPSLAAFIILIGVLGNEFYSQEYHERKFVSDEVRVVDGDTIVLMEGVNKRSVRLQGIDAPELKQSCTLYNKQGKAVKYPCGEQSKDFLTKLIGKKQVACTDEGKDKYKRQLSYCFVDDLHLNRVMVRRGYAVAYVSFDITFMFEEWVAQYQNQGLWRGEFMNPAEWRKTEKNKKDR